jgi:hypothetical protein
VLCANPLEVARTPPLLGMAPPCTGTSERYSTTLTQTFLPVDSHGQGGVCKHGIARSMHK